jgi:hypothetical protein
MQSLRLDRSPADRSTPNTHPLRLFSGQWASTSVCLDFSRLARAKCLVMGFRITMRRMWAAGRVLPSVARDNSRTGHSSVGAKLRGLGGRPQRPLRCLASAVPVAADDRSRIGCSTDEPSQWLARSASSTSCWCSPTGRPRLSAALRIRYWTVFLYSISRSAEHHRHGCDLAERYRLRRARSRGERGGLGRDGLLMGDTEPRDALGRVAEGEMNVGVRPGRAGHRGVERVPDPQW